MFPFYTKNAENFFLQLHFGTKPSLLLSVYYDIIKLKRHPKTQKTENNMPTLTIIQNNSEKKIVFDGEKKLYELLGSADVHADMPCGGRGVCKKCTVFIDGKTELACKYVVTKDTTVIIPDTKDIISETGVSETQEITENVCLCLDLGTTTLALALVSCDNGSIIKVKTASNPQRKFGADVISRIDYCSKNSPVPLRQVIIEKINYMTKELLREYGLSSCEKMYIAGNTTMLHLFYGIDCSCLGVSPYTPRFLDEKTVSAKTAGIDKVESVTTLCGVSAFVGADIVSGLYYLDVPQEAEKYSLLIDLGTNAEIVLFRKGMYLCSSAAAGPCFEGANISCGMSASIGAVSEYSIDGTYSVIGNAEPVGICATGLIDVIASLLRKGLIDESGYMEDEEFYICRNVKITAGDIREFQLAKSAVRSCIECLLKKEGISYDSIEKMYVAGGFSSQMNIGNAVFLGLLPKELREKFTPVNNACLKGLIKYAANKEDLSFITQNAEFFDIGTYDLFSQLFFENMSF